MGRIVPAWLRSASLHRFAVVGAVGFAVDAGLLTWLMGLGMNVLPSRLLSFGTAVSITWLLNRRWSFGHLPARRDGRGYLVYLLVQIVGAGINLSVFAWLVTAWPATRAWPVLPLALAAGVSLIFNYLASRRWAFAADPT